MPSPLVLGLLLTVLLAAVDYYVYRNWRFFSRLKPALRWTLPPYRVLLVVMPLVLPAYFYFSRWWEVEPKLLRAVVIGGWITYYLPKLFLAVAFALKDAAWSVSWLFDWFQERLRGGKPHAGAGIPSRHVGAGAEVEADALDLADMKRLTRAEFLRRMGWTAASIPFVVVGYGVFRTLYDFEVHRVDLTLPNLPRSLDGLTIAQLSDLHAGSFFSQRPIEEAVATLNGLRPALVAITGDFVNHDAAELALLRRPLEALRPELGTFACLGNHDHYASVREVVAGVRATPVDLLVNEHRTLTLDGAHLRVVGTDNTGFRQYYADLPAAVAGLPSHPQEDEFRLLLAHDPTFWDDYVRPSDAHIDLMLAGHTHGGQVGFEFGPLRWSLAKTVYARWAGLYAEARAGDEERAGEAGRGPQYLYVNRGLGTVGPPIRLGIRPEITLVTLRRAA